MKIEINCISRNSVLVKYWCKFSRKFSGHVSNMLVRSKCPIFCPPFTRGARTCMQFESGWWRLMKLMNWIPISNSSESNLVREYLTVLIMEIPAQFKSSSLLHFDFLVKCKKSSGLALHAKQWYHSMLSWRNTINQRFKWFNSQNAHSEGISRLWCIAFDCNRKLVPWYDFEKLFRE